MYAHLFNFVVVTWVESGAKSPRKIVNNFMLTQRGKGLSQKRFEAFLEGTPAGKGQMGYCQLVSSPRDE